MAQHTHSMSTKCLFLLKDINLRTDSERKWALEAESKPKLKENICIIKICLNKWFKDLTPIGPKALIPWVQSVIIIKINESHD